MDIKEMRSRLEAIASEMDEVIQADELDEERFAALDAEASELRAKIEREKKVNEVRSLAADASNIERTAPAVIIRDDENKDPYELRSVPVLGRSEREVASELRARAIDAIERDKEMEDAHKEQATKLVQRDNRRGDLSKHILVTGAPAYRSAFEKYVADPTHFHVDLTDGERQAMRAAFSLTDANGGYLVPFTLDPSIILTNDGSSNPFRRISTVKTIATDNWNGVSSAGVTAEWLAEATEAADATPTFAQPTITPEKAAAYLQGSFEAIADASLAGEIGPLLADAKDRLEATAFAVGSGANQPQGIVTALTGTSSVVTSATTDTFAVGDVYSTEEAVPARHRDRAVAVANNKIINKIRQFGTADSHAMLTRLADGQPTQLLGHSLYDSSAMDGTINATADNYVLIFGDFSQYYIVDRVGMSLLYEPLVKGANRRPTGEAGWFAYWRVGADSVSDNAFRLLNVT